MNKHIINRIMLLCCCLVTACSKDVTPPDVITKSGIFFYNGSYALSKQVFDNMGNSRNWLLIDNQDTAYQTIPSEIPALPCFSRSNPEVYPASRGGWPILMPVATGTHTLLLTDTSGLVIDKSSLNITTDVQTAVFYGDYFGKYKSLVLTDTYVPLQGSAGIRLVNLSPSEHPVYITIDKVIPAVLPAATKYGDHTPFLQLPLSRQDTLNIKVYREGDESKEILGRAQLTAMPGHAYTLVMTGYRTDGPTSYNDPRSGKTVMIQPNFQITVLKNY
ncbi:DUF4397 domain-containing protein [Chitinophaga solisilvae]|uniref:DUF4397 domain-containing protein n=1 Tax=Chitinophaga solisilvae TaxID=1233460 RepID=A0A9Q5D9F5_9BACT|nr:DUF4397 domain-containing protein [Chitinophaga solisilvae]NSL90519.1 DUF4397 domain-containing protein [Chitinophaga solisilvae]